MQALLSLFLSVAANILYSRTRVAAPSVCFATARILLAGPNSSSLFPPLAAVVAVASGLTDG